MTRANASHRAWWERAAFAARRPTLEARARIVAGVRAHFTGEGFVEVETPALQVCPGLEPHLHAFETELSSPTGDGSVRRYLHTSPELSMKKLVVAGMPRIFQIAHAFRNEERGATHHPEFTLLEWYRAEADVTSLYADCEALLCVAARCAGTRALRHRGVVCDPAAPSERLTVAEALAAHAGVEVCALREKAGDAFEDELHRTFLERVESHLGVGRATLLVDWPIELAALARQKPGQPDVAERVELYACGLELANGFGELTDPLEQRRRFEHDRARKRALYGREYPIDPDFMAALAHGMPACAGMALGLDRLVMLATGCDHIEDVLWAPVDADRVARTQVP
jgi:lysyl-tRNA synthetase class 2